MTNHKTQQIYRKTKSKTTFVNDIRKLDKIKTKQKTKHMQQKRVLLIGSMLVISFQS